MRDLHMFCNICPTTQTDQFRPVARILTGAGISSSRDAVGAEADTCSIRLLLDPTSPMLWCTARHASGGALLDHSFSHARSLYQRINDPAALSVTCVDRMVAEYNVIAAAMPSTAAIDV